MDATQIAIRRAAKLAGVDYRYALRLIDARKLRAFKWAAPRVPGHRPRLRVYLHELKAAVEVDRLYEPPTPAPAPMPRPKVRRMHPSVAMAFQD